MVLGGGGPHEGFGVVVVGVDVFLGIEATSFGHGVEGDAAPQRSAWVIYGNWCPDEVVVMMHKMTSGPSGGGNRGGCLSSHLWDAFVLVGGVVVQDQVDSLGLFLGHPPVDGPRGFFNHF